MRVSCHMIVLFWIFEELLYTFSITAILICIPMDTASVQVSLILVRLSSYCFVLIMTILTGVGQNLIVVLVCITLMISDYDHLFIYLLSNCMSSLQKFHVLCLFFNLIIRFSFSFLITELSEFLSILNINHLPGIWFAIFISFDKLLFTFIINSWAII
jgi:hypothetical protein